MKIIKYILKRLMIFIPLFIGIIFVTFILVRLLPGSPAEALAGSMAYEDTIRSLEEKMGLNKPIIEQFAIYIKNIFKGDLGYSWFTSNPVWDDIKLRFPATIELITISIIFALGFGVTLGSVAAMKPKGIASKISRIYGMAAGSFADFWVGLMLVFLFFTTLGWAPSPMGRLDLLVSPPTRVTGMYVLDSLLTQNWEALKSSIAHLVLPVLTLSLVHGAAVMKMTNATMNEIIQSDYIHHAKIMGLSQRKIRNYALRNAIPTILTTVGNIYAFLIGGAVLIEQVFSWGGLGQYVTTALSNKDYSAIQGFVLVATVFSMLIYFVIDIIHMIIDRRIEL